MNLKKISLLISTILFLTLVSCRKETVSHVGDNILPAGDKFKVSYVEIPFSAKTVKGEENLFKINGQNTALFGSYNFNDEFGTSQAAFLTQIKLNKENPDFGTNPKIDSVMFYFLLKDSASYGDKNTPLQFKIYELNKSIYSDSTYYANQFDYRNYINENSTICDTSFSVSEIKDNFITFNLDTNFAHKILYAPADSLADNATFINYIKGICVTADTVANGGAVLYGSHLSKNTQIVIYYHNINSETSDTTYNKFELLINNNCASVNSFYHSYGNINFNDSTQEYVYIQGMGGAIGKVDFSLLKTFFADSGKVMVNKAEVILPNEEDVLGTYSPREIMLERIDTDSLTTLAQKGYLSDDKTEYSVVLTGYINDIITGAESFTQMYIYPAYPVINAGKTKIINNKNNKSIKLKITYTKY